MGIPKGAVPGEVVYRQPHAAAGHEWLSHGPVAIPERSFVSPPFSATSDTMQQVQQSIKERRLRPIDPTVMTFAQSVGGSDIPRMEQGLLDALKADKKAR